MNNSGRSKFAYFIFIFVSFVCANSQAVDLPTHLPNGPHPRIWLTPSKLAQVKQKQATNSSDWQELYIWCESNLNLTGYDAAIGTSGFGNWPSNQGYRGDMWAKHIINYTLAYKVLNGTAQQTKADQYAARAILLLDNMLRGSSSGEETNGLGMIRMGDTKDWTVNAAEAAALKEQNPGITAVGSKNGYGVRFAVFATAIGYDWLYEKLTPAQKANYQAYIFRTIDWVNGKRSTYNNGVLWKGVRYYEDTDGPCTGTTDAGETISCTTVARTVGSPYQFAFAYSDPGDNYWAGFFISGMLGTVATYGDNPDAAAYFNYVKDTWWNSMLKARWNDPMEFKGGDPSEGWNYGWGLIRDIWALRGLETATNEDVFAGLTFPAEATKAYMHDTASNLSDIIPSGDWGNANRGKLGYQHIFTLTSLLQSKSDPLAPVAKTFLDSATYYSTTNAGSIGTWEKLLFSDTSSTAALSTLPLDYLSVGNGTVDMRSTWTNAPDSVHASFLMKKDIPGMSHDNYDAGHFYIQRGNDRLLSESFGHESWRHSIISFGGLQQQTRGDINATIPSVQLYESGNGYLYFKGDLTDAYTRKSNLWSILTKYAANYKKSVVYIRPIMWVIYDVTQSGPQAPNFTKEWYSQYPVNGTTGLSVDAVGSTIITQVGSSKAYLKTIYPTDVTFTQDTIPDAPTYGRVKMKPNVVQEYDQFLHVIEATASKSSQTPVEKVQTLDGKMIGAYIKSPLNPTIVLFSSDKNGADVAVSSGDIISYNLPGIISNSLQHILVHLPPNADFTTLPITSANGLVTFRLKTGAFPAEGKVSRASSQGVVRLDAASLSPPAAPSNPK